MHCMNCNKHVSECKCPDIDERLASLGAPGSMVMVAFCNRCGLHHARCKCPEPKTFTIRGLE